MANLEIQIGADASELNSELSKVEKQLRTLERRQELRVRAGLDTGDLNRRISETRGNLDRLRTSLNSVGQSASGFQRPVANAGNTLTNFSRIAQDAPFGIMGIGNNLTATAEAFSSLSRQAGGAGGALRALGSSLLGGGGVLLAISLVTTALTVMSQKGLTVGDVFNKLSGNFDQFKKDLSDVNKEAAKNSAEEVQRVKSLTQVAKDEALTRQQRLIAVQKLQDEYPAYFGNLTKEQILNGNVGTAIKDVVAAIKEKARAQALSGKLTELAAKEFELTEKQAKQQELVNKATIKKADLEKKLASEQFNEQTYKSLQQITRALNSYNDDLGDTKKELSAIVTETDKWANAATVSTKKSILLDFKPDKIKKAKVEINRGIQELGTGLTPLGLDSIINVDAGLFKSNAGLGADMDAFIDRLRSMADETRTVLFDWKNVIGSALGDVGTSIGEALASGGNALQAVGSSLLNTLGSLLSSIGDKLIAVGLTAVIAGSALATMFTPAGIAAGLAAIALGTTLKAGAGFLGGMSKNMSSGGGSNKVSAGNSVSSPTSSVSSGGSFSSGLQTVVFEISGQSLVGVLSNTMNKNVKLGGALPAI